MVALQGFERASIHSSWEADHQYPQLVQKFLVLVALESAVAALVVDSADSAGSAVPAGSAGSVDSDVLAQHPDQH